MTWLSQAWGVIWPNLVADAMWVPVVGVSHWVTRRHLSRIHQDLKGGGQE